MLKSTEDNNLSITEIEKASKDPRKLRASYSRYVEMMVLVFG